MIIFIFISVLVHAPCNSSSIMMNCTQPNPVSLLEALKPVFSIGSVRPVMNTSTATSVTVDFTLFGILGVNEKSQILTTYIWLNVLWNNEFIRWTPEQCGSDYITIPRKELWVPDVVIVEFMEKNTAPFVPYTYVFSDGTIFDPQPVKVVSSCRLDIYTFPFDTQTCTLTFTSYLHRMDAVKLTNFTPVEKTLTNSKQSMTTMGEWELVGITLDKYEREDGEGELNQELRYFVSVRRQSTMYVVNLLLPSSFLITVDLFSFLLPPKSVDRSAFKMTLILGYTVFLLLMNNLLPVTGNTIPLINVFLSLCLALMVASLLETVLITNLLCGSALCCPVPCWITVCVLHILGRLVCLSPKPRDLEGTVIQNPNTQEMKISSLVAEDSKAPEEKGLLDEDKALEELRSLGKDLQALRLQVDQLLGENQTLEDWAQVGLVIDRLLFIVYILFISVSFFTIIIIWSQSIKSP
uniref:5-hydroxytryptamine (serotonin) receptor 3B n=2 Tax=Monopterus albus TaxID=43700 RepID=A0A3Q3K2F7_MONAL